MLLKFAVAAVAALTSAVASAQSLVFYFDFLGEFNCGGAPLDGKSITTSCMDISGESFLTKPWSALKGVDLGGCKVAAYPQASCGGTPTMLAEGQCLAPDNKDAFPSVKLLC